MPPINFRAPRKQRHAPPRLDLLQALDDNPARFRVCSCQFLNQLHDPFKLNGGQIVLLSLLVQREQECLILGLEPIVEKSRRKSMKPKRGSRTESGKPSLKLVKPERMNDPGIVELGRKIATGAYEKVLLCEGDSWFDIYTPAPLHEPNLLDAIRTPRSALLVDISHVGDTAREMATGSQASKTLALLNEFKFDALLLSAGGNDLKNAFKEAYIAKIVHAKTRSVLPPDIRTMTAEPAAADDLFREVVGYIVTWLGLRQRSRLNQDTPVLLHGYDYLQPRPAHARIFVNGPRASGPWIYPILKADKKTDDEMRRIAKDVIDRFNHWLETLVKPLPGVHLLDTRKTLKIAEPKTTKASNDWMDEIHATPDGWAKLAAAAWNPTLAKILA
jgi:hypothetical protein